jgi:hypothetical protein
MIAAVVVPKVRPVVKSGPAAIPAEVRQWHSFVTARVTDRVGPEQRLRVAHLLKGMGFTGTLLFTALSPAELRDSRDMWPDSVGDEDWSLIRSLHVTPAVAVAPPPARRQPRSVTSGGFTLYKSGEEKPGNQLSPVQVI